MYKIAFLGDERLLSFYRPLGFALFSPRTEREARMVLNRLRQENYSIVFVTEAVYKMAKKAIKELDRDFIPSVAILPGYGEHERLGSRRLDELIENAVGIKI